MKKKHLITITTIGTWIGIFSFLTGLDLPSILQWSAQKFDSLSRSDVSLSSRHTQHANMFGYDSETDQTETARETQVKDNTLRGQKMNYFNKEKQRIVDLIKQGKPEEANNLFSKLKEEIQIAKTSG
jgi:hypothetical protein